MSDHECNEGSSLRRLQARIETHEIAPAAGNLAESLLPCVHTIAQQAIDHLANGLVDCDAASLRNEAIAITLVAVAARAAHTKAGRGADDIESTIERIYDVIELGARLDQNLIGLVTQAVNEKELNPKMLAREFLALVYEDLLSLRLETIGDGQRFVLDPKAKKRGGNFYTPAEFSRLVVGYALSPCMQSDSRWTEKKLLDMKVLDPAMGGGSFLLAAVDFLCAALELTQDDRRRRSLFENCLFGVDIDPLARIVACLTLWLDAQMPHAAMDFDLLECLGRNLRVGNALCAWQSDFWPNEFPSIFLADGGGFDAVIGNPPWEIEKPNSREFFGRFDRDYWSYGKQKALQRQKELLENPAILEQWNDYRASFARVRGEEGNSAAPSFELQGGADLNAYKLFLELSLKLLKDGGCLGLILPAGIYNDRGCKDLRRFLLDQCNWHSLIGFENKLCVFDIHRSFKFCVIAAQRGGPTKRVATSFMLNTPAEGARPHLFYERKTLDKLSPKYNCVLEIEDKRDSAILEKLFDQSTLLGDGSWALTYKREFDMTNDSALFEPRERMEAEGYVQDQYGHWLKGKWMPVVHGAPQRSALMSAEGALIIEADDIVDIALPLYEGRMIGQFDFSDKGWIAGKGRSAVWAPIAWPSKALSPQYLMRAAIFDARYPRTDQGADLLKVGFLGVGSATNTRSMIASCLDNLPCGNSVPVFKTASNEEALALTAVLNSFVFDFVLRCRMAGNNLNYFILEECPLPSLGKVLASKQLIEIARTLNLCHARFARQWLRSPQHDGAYRWITRDDERATARSYLDALVAHLYGLSLDDFAWILRDCQRAAPLIAGRSSSPRQLRAKGFWRVDKAKEPTERHSVKALALYERLAGIGIAAFLGEIEEKLLLAAATIDQAELNAHAARLTALEAIRRSFR